MNRLICNILEQQYTTRIPVTFIKSDSSSMNLIDFEQRTDRIRACIVCKHLFNDLSSTGLCSECDYNDRHTLSRLVSPGRSSTNIYPANYKNSDFITPIAPTSRITGPRNIHCPNCRQLNILHQINSRMVFRCIKCYCLIRVWNQ